MYQRTYVGAVGYVTLRGELWSKTRESRRSTRTAGLARWSNCLISSSSRVPDLISVVFLLYLSPSYARLDPTCNEANGAATMSAARNLHSLLPEGEGIVAKNTIMQLLSILNLLFAGIRT